MYFFTFNLLFLNNLIINTKRQSSLYLELILLVKDSRLKIFCIQFSVDFYYSAFSLRTDSKLRLNTEH